MRDFQLPGRSPAHGLNGMAATSHPLATLTALDMLRDGGNAVDAAVAACAVQCVVEPQSTGLGGDCFVLYAPAGKAPPIALNGSGRAPAAAETAWFLERGITAIELESPHAVTVPGAVDAWARLVADYGTRDLGELLRPAIALAEEGYAVHSRVAYDWVRAVEKLGANEHAARVFLPGGEAPAAGAVHRQPALAETLKRIAREGRDGFYTGAVAEDIVDYLRSLGGLHTLDDFARHEGEYVTPIKTGYRGVEVYQCPPNGQGIVTLIMLNIMSGFDLATLDPLGADRMHIAAETARLAYRDRDALIADPAKAEVPVEMLLSSDYADAMRGLIRPDRALSNLPPPGMGDHRDTVYLTVVDRDRNAISIINSLDPGFGSGLMSPKAGVMLHNRGACFVVDPDHPNTIAPDKRPLNTIIPGMLAEGTRAVMPFGVMGGHFQPTGQTHFLTNLIDFGMDVQEALDLARAFHFGDVLTLEKGIPDSVMEELAGRGHSVDRAEGPLGGGQAIWIDWQSGVLTGGSDPRKDGCALGY